MTAPSADSQMTEDSGQLPDDRPLMARDKRMRGIILRCIEHNKNPFLPSMTIPCTEIIKYILWLEWQLSPEVENELYHRKNNEIIEP